MKKRKQIKFIEVDEEADFFEKMAAIIEINNQTLMYVRKLSRREAYEILCKGKKSMNCHNDVIDTYEEEPKTVYPNPDTKEGYEKMLYIHRLVNYIKTKPDLEEESGEVLLLDKKANIFYQPELSYFKVKTKETGTDGTPRCDYYKAVLLHDISKYVKEEIRLLEDATTGVPGKKQLMPMLIDYISQAIVKKESFSLTMLDIDHFKNINDTHGHQFGDQVLKALAQLVNRSIRHDDARTHDIMSRFGGEEFVFTLNNIQYEDAVKTNERIRAKVERNLEYFDNIKIGLTISMGMVFVDAQQIQNIKPTDRKKIKAFASKIIKEADDYMYKSKNSGRNRVTVVKYISDKDRDEK